MRLILTRLTIFLCALLFTPLVVLGDGTPGARQGAFAITNARLVTVTNGIVENGTIVIQGDRITAMGPSVSIPEDAEIIDVGGKSIYPGMIDSGTQLGLVEVSSVPETVDSREVGDVTPQVRALTAINPNSVSIPVTRVGGVTTVIAEPSGGLLSGTSALINLHGYTPAQMFAGFEAPVLEFPTSGRRSRWDQRTDDEVKKAYETALERLNDVWDDAELFHRIDSAATQGAGINPEYAPQMAALVPVVRGERKLIVKVEAAQDITNAIEWLQSRGIDNAILSGVTEGWRVADKIAEAGYPVLAGPVLTVATRQSDRYDKPYANAGLMHQAGVTVALRTGEIENVRNLPFNAGFAAAYGLGRDEALRAVTINPARIFGVDADLGSLEVGKKATLFVADGDPFEPQTEVTHLFIDGYNIPLVSRQTRLYDEFLERSPGATE